MYDIFLMNMGGHDENTICLQERYPHMKVVRYYNNHLDTIKRCLSRARTPYIWIIASCCDYTDFDFEYQALPWEENQIHCWASGSQQYGETFLIPVAEFKKQLNKIGDILEWFEYINWHEDGVPRLEWPLLELDMDPVAEIKAFENDAPFFHINQRVDLDLNLWRKPWYLHKITETGGVSLAPREIRGYLEGHIYDYPWIKDTIIPEISNKLCDIIYLSNGEPDAERWFERLTASVTSGNTIQRVMNVNGRKNAYRAAAEASSTPWFFAVFAKLEVLQDFDWTWQPDILHLKEEPKHYIFFSKNPVNGLEYGHMGVIAYNKKLVLETEEHGLDFTLSKEHVVVPKVSAIAHFNTTPELTWRTAFREVLKLKDDVVKTGSIESKSRLKTWLNVAEGQHAEYSILGAKDAVDYYDEVDGDYNKLLLSFDWAWLQSHYQRLGHH